MCRDGVHQSQEDGFKNLAGSMYCRRKQVGRKEVANLGRVYMILLAAKSVCSFPAFLKFLKIQFVVCLRLIFKPESVKFKSEILDGGSEPSLQFMLII